MIRLVSRNGTDPMPVEWMTEMAEHLKREDTVEDDEYINRCLLRAIDKAERFTGHVLVDSTFDMSIDTFPSGSPYGYGATTTIYIRRAPLLEVNSVSYRNTSGASTILDSGMYTVDLIGGLISLPVASSWPETDGTANAVTVRFRAGYIDYSTYPPTVGEVPPTLEMAIMVMAAESYGNRDNEQMSTPTRIPWGAEYDLRLLRIDDSLA